MIKALIFDCFGVLYPHASGDFFERNKNLFGNNSSVMDKLNLQIDLGEITRADLFKRLEEITGIDADKIKAEYDQKTIADQALVEFIRKLKPLYKIGLLSNAGKEEIDIIYRDKLDDLFDATAVSYEVKSVKPDPEIFLICAQRLNLKPEQCVFVDDSPMNIEAARKLGMKTVLYPNFGSIPKDLASYLNQQQ
jgi:HAD superfamily hydrolase (TIGR01509 family)